MSATQVSSGRAALKSRLTRSGAGAVCLSGVAVTQLGMQPRRPVDLIGCLPRLPDQRLQPLVLDATAAEQTMLPGPVALPADVQHRAQPGDGVVRPLLIDQLERHGSRPVSRAKYAAAFCKINFSSSSRRTSRRSFTISACSSRVVPSR